MIKNDNSLLFTVLVSGIFIAVVSIVIQFDLIEKAQSIFSSNQQEMNGKNEKKVLVTYYQWQENGKMVIDKKPPKDGREYITFQGDINLTNTHHDIDPQLIARAEAFRKELEGKSDVVEETSNDLIASLLTPEQQELLRTEGACVELESWLNNMSQAFKHYDKDTTLSFCSELDERLANLANMGCQKEIQNFKTKICPN